MNKQKLSNTLIKFIISETNYISYNFINKIEYLNSLLKLT